MRNKKTKIAQYIIIVFNVNIIFFVNKIEFSVIFSILNLYLLKYTRTHFSTD